MKCINCKHNVFIEENKNGFWGYCKKLSDDVDMEWETTCRFFEKQSNADKIRAMDDFELAGFLLEVINAYDKPCMMNIRDCKWADCEEHGCDDCFLEWLQEEAEET